MSHFVPFDTLAYTKKLTAGGVEPYLAEVHAEALVGILESIATKEETNNSLNRFGEETNTRIEQLSKETNNRIDQLGEEINNRIDRLSEETDHRINQLSKEICILKEDMDNKFSIVDMRFADVDAKFEKLDDRMENLETRVGSLEIKVEKIDTKLVGLKLEMIKWVLGIVFSVSSAQAALLISILRVSH